MIALLENLRATLHLELSERFNLVSSKSGRTRIIFTFNSEETGIRGAAALRKWLNKSEISGRVIQSETGNTVFLYPEMTE